MTKRSAAGASGTPNQPGAPGEAKGWVGQQLDGQEGLDSGEMPLPGRERQRRGEREECVVTENHNKNRNAWMERVGS